MSGQLEEWGSVSLPWVYVHLGSISRGCLLISQKVILVWCSRALYTWGFLVGGPSSFLNRLYCFDIAGFCTLSVN